MTGPLLLAAAAVAAVVASPFILRRLRSPKTRPAHPRMPLAPRPDAAPARREDPPPSVPHEYGGAVIIGRDQPHDRQ